MTATRVCDMETVSAIVIDADTVQIGGSNFKREYLANYELDQNDITRPVKSVDLACSFCDSVMSVLEDEDMPNFCPNCGARFTDIQQLPFGYPEKYLE